MYGDVVDNWKPQPPYYMENGANFPTVVPDSVRQELIDYAYKCVIAMGFFQGTAFLYERDVVCRSSSYALISPKRLPFVRMAATDGEKKRVRGYHSATHRPTRLRPPLYAGSHSSNRIGRRPPRIIFQSHFQAATLHVYALNPQTECRAIPHTCRGIPCGVHVH